MNFASLAALPLKFSVRLKRGKGVDIPKYDKARKETLNAFSGKM